ncbi:MAG: hypothetical protein ACLFUG_12295 [Nitriliruptoraceae bacterium]
MPGYAVALLGGEHLAAPLAERTGLPVVATTPTDHLAVAAELGGSAELVIGLAAVPWPTEVELHAEGSATLPAYTGVVSWHALPALAELLAASVAPGARRGAHVLLTAPDPGPETEPGDVLFLREVAEAVAGRVQLPSRSVAWRGTTRAPTAVDALRSLVEAHGQRDIVECPVAPLTPADRELDEVARELGCRLTSIDLGRAALLDLLAEVVGTVLGYEEDGDDALADLLDEPDDPAPGPGPSGADGDDPDQRP